MFTVSIFHVFTMSAIRAMNHIIYYPRIISPAKRQHVTIHCCLAQRAVHKHGFTQSVSWTVNAQSYPSGVQAAQSTRLIRGARVWSLLNNLQRAVPKRNHKIQGQCCTKKPLRFPTISSLLSDSARDTKKHYHCKN